MATGYILPSDTDYVSCSWQCHRNRNPPSSEPGTDYASGYGSPLYAVGNGVIYDTKTTTSNATGRYISINLDDGRRTRSLHLSEVWVSPGQRVHQGQQIGRTGASGYGTEWGYGAHVHQSLWAVQEYTFCSTCTIDFALYVGDTPPNPNPDPDPGEEDNEMILLESLPDRGRALVGPGYYKKLNNSEELTAASQIASKTLKGNARQFDVWKAVIYGNGHNSPIDGPVNATIDSATVKAIADAVTAEIEVPPIDDATIQRIADAVNEEMSERLSG